MKMTPTNIYAAENSLEAATWPITVPVSDTDYVELSGSLGILVGS